MPTTLNSGLQLPDKGSVDWYGSMQTNYNLLDNHLENTDIHVTAEDKANWDSKQGSLSQAQLDAIAQVSTNTSDIATLQSGKANASHTHSSSDITDIGDYATKQYVDNSISGLVDNAPDALNTLNELSAALNDDSNFASTVTTALSAKANSADLATVATSGDYDDLGNKPSIPTNTSDLNNDSGFVTLNDFDIPSKTSDLTNDSGFITSSDVPTGTSDLINDSNFVDTSNSAVASGITSAKVTDYDTHIADTDIHVTTADKTKWNNNVTQSFVFRYSSTALVASSTNSNALLDNTDNLKVGDKVIDSSGVIYSVTAIDTANSTFTIGTSLIDLAQDSDVVHKSGDETTTGFKQFANIRANNSIKGINLEGTTTDLNNCYSNFAPDGENKGGNIQYYTCNTDAGTANISNLPEAKAFFLTSITTRLISNSLYVKQILINSNSKTFTRYCANSTWSSWVNETDSEYVHKSGNETIGGVKSFINYFLGKDLSGQTVDLNDCVDAYSGAIHYYYAVSNYTNISNKPENKPFILESKTVRYVSSIDYIYYQKIYIADYNTAPSIYTRYYRSGSASWSNWIKDTDKFVTTDTAQTVSGSKTFSVTPYIYNSDSTGSTPWLTFKSSKANKGGIIANADGVRINYRDKNDNLLSYIQLRKQSNGVSDINLYCSTLDGNNQEINSEITFFKAVDGSSAFSSVNDNNISLGNSTYKWKDVNTYLVNGLEPSSLSLPNIDNRVDISSYITDLTGVGNEYTPPVNGWICVRSGNANKISILDSGTNIGNISISNTATYLTLMSPCVANRKVYINIMCTSLSYAYFIPCLGNV